MFTSLEKVFFQPEGEKHRLFPLLMYGATLLTDVPGLVRAEFLLFEWIFVTITVSKGLFMFGLFFRLLSFEASESFGRVTYRR